MTASKLIQVLSRLPPLTPILVEGYEGGMSDVKILRPVVYLPNYNSEGYYGPHEEVNPNDESNDPSTVLSGYLICR